MGMGLGEREDDGGMAEWRWILPSGERLKSSIYPQLQIVNRLLLRGIYLAIDYVNVG